MRDGLLSRGLSRHHGFCDRSRRRLNCPALCHFISRFEMTARRYARSGTFVSRFPSCFDPKHYGPILGHRTGFSPPEKQPAQPRDTFQLGSSRFSSFPAGLPRARVCDGPAPWGEH